MFVTLVTENLVKSAENPENERQSVIRKLLFLFNVSRKRKWESGVKQRERERECIVVGEREREKVVHLREKDLKDKGEMDSKY